MKICSPQLGLSPNSSLGGEIYDYQTIKGLTQKGVEFLIYIPKNRPYDHSLKNLKVEYCFITHVVPPWIYSFLSLPYLYRTYKKEKFDILRIHSPRFLGLAAIIFHIFYPKVPVMASQVTVDASPFFFPIEWVTLKISKLVIVQSEYMRNLISKKYGIDPQKIYVTYGGMLQVEKASPSIPKEAKKLGVKTFVILFMGVLVKRKNANYLIDVLNECKKTITDIKLVIIGNGPEKRKIIEKVKTNKLKDDTILIDSAYNSEKAYWFSRMDIFLMPSLDEGFGLAATEAMSYGKPVITSNKAAFKEIIKNGKDGFTLPLEGKETWAQAISKLYEHPSLAKKIGNNAQKTVQDRFNWNRTANLNYQAIKSILK